MPAEKAIKILLKAAQRCAAHNNFAMEFPLRESTIYEFSQPIVVDKSTIIDWQPPTTCPRSLRPVTTIPRDVENANEIFASIFCARA